LSWSFVKAVLFFLAFPGLAAGGRISIFELVTISPSLLLLSVRIMPVGSGIDTGPKPGGMQLAGYSSGLKGRKREIFG